MIHGNNDELLGKSILVGITYKTTEGIVTLAGTPGRIFAILRTGARRAAHPGARDSRAARLGRFCHGGGEVRGWNGMTGGHSIKVKPSP